MINPILVIDVSYAVLTLVLVVLGLSIIFGMLRVINMAHGEKMMLGAYTVFLAEQYQLPMFVGVIGAVVVTAIAGAVVYWLIVRNIRHRLLDSILATWGVSIILKQAVTLLFGAQGQHVSAPINQSVILFGEQYPVYRLVVMGATILTVLILYLIFFKSHFGIRARAVMSNPTLATCVGVNRRQLNLISFMIGSAVAGLAGAVIAPLMSISPLLGQDYLVPAFLSVLVGGLGSILAPIFGAGIIAGSESIASVFFDSVIAQIIMLCLAILILKLFPNGIRKND